MIRPLFDKIILEKIEEDNETPGGIIIPDAAKEKPSKGRVRAIGDEVKRLKVDDTVLFSKYAGSEFTFDDLSCLILREEDVLGVL